MKFLQYKDNKKSKKLDIPKFAIAGSVVTTNCELTSSFEGKMPPFNSLSSHHPFLIIPSFTGMVRIEECDAAIKCIDLQVDCSSCNACRVDPTSLTLFQLVRVECCKSEQGDATESSEIQALQATHTNVVFHLSCFNMRFRSLTAMCRAVSTSQFTWSSRACSPALPSQCQNFKWILK